MKTLTALSALLLLSSGSVQAQIAGSASAVMRVQVEIIGGAQFDQQLVQANAGEVEMMDRGEQVYFGQFSITVPEGADYSIHMDREIEMHGEGTWAIDSSIQNQFDGESQTFHLSGRTVKGGDIVAYRGGYDGRHSAVLEFH